MMLHPATVHFAMVLPLVASAFSVAYLFKKTELLAKLSSATIFIAAIAMIVVWYTGSQAGPQIYNYLSEAGQHELVEHKTLGLYLALAMGLILLLKVIGCKINNFIIESIAIALLLGTTLVTFAQGKDGGELVYKYGTPFKSYLIMDSLKEAAITAQESDDTAEKLESYTDAVDDITMHSEEIDEFYGVEKSTSDENEEEEE